ncbi:MAG: amidohydrolase family protein, partial [Chloroflexota bacterium]
MLLDVHAHPPRDRSQLPAYLAALERFDSRVLLSELGGPRRRDWVHVPEVEHWQEGNAGSAELVRRYPDRLLGYCYVNPAHGREALEEMERRLVGEPEIFAGLKLWVAVRCSDPCLDPIMELCAAHGVPVLQHTWMKVGDGGPGSGNLPGESTPADLLALARRHPRVKFFGGHIGGDWEWGVAALKQVDNVWLDIAGGDATGGYMDLALREVGAGRIVFGTDVPGRSIPSQLAKVLALDLPDHDLERILWRNAVDVLGDRLPNAWREKYGGALTPTPIQGEGSATYPPPGSDPLRSAHSPASPQGKGSPASAEAAPGVSPSLLGEGARLLGPSWASARIPTAPRPGAGGLVDASSFLGEWPSRRLNGSPPPTQQRMVEQRLRLMDRLGIQRAAVALLDGAWLKDSGVANAELFAMVGQRADRFLPVYTLNPLFPAWAEQLGRCVQEHGLAAGRGAVRLYPSYHGYQLDDPGIE